jgi:hypothetical protein
VVSMWLTGTTGGRSVGLPQFDIMMFRMRG